MLLLGAVGCVLVLGHGLRQEALHLGLAVRPAVVAGDWVAPAFMRAAEAASVAFALFVVLALVRRRSAQARWLAWLLAWGSAGVAALAFEEAWIARRIARAQATGGLLVRDAVGPAIALRAATLAVLIVGALALGAAFVRANKSNGRAWVSLASTWALLAAAVAAFLLPRPALARLLGAPQRWEKDPPAHFQPVRLAGAEERSPGPFALPEMSGIVLPGRFVLPKADHCHRHPSPMPIAVDRRATVADLHRAFDCLPDVTFDIVWPVAGAYTAAERSRLARWYPLLAGLTPRHFRRLEPDIAYVRVAAPDDVSAVTLLTVLGVLRQAGLTSSLARPPAPGASAPAKPAEPSPMTKTETVRIGSRAVIVFAPPDLDPALGEQTDEPSIEAVAHIGYGLDDLDDCLRGRHLDVHLVFATTLVLVHGGKRRRIDLPTDWPRSVGAVLVAPRKEPCMLYAESGPSSLGDFLTEGVAEYYGIRSCRQEGGMQGVCK